MATAVKSSRVSKKLKAIPPLENGDRLDQKTFHVRYEAMPKHVKAELIGGVVFMPSPQKLPHGRSHVGVIRWLSEYEEETPGTELSVGSTQIMGPDSEPQPDAALYVAPEYGGQIGVNKDDYLTGAADLISEISSATESIDLHWKKDDYEKAGVREYIVVALRMRKVFWFIRHRGKFKEMMPDSDGIYRSQVFPGLWLDPAALLRRDRKRLLAVVREGINTPEHTAFVAKLADK